MLLVTFAYIYLCISFIEWFFHAKVMHGNPDVLCNVPFIGNYLAQTARDHNEHHRHVQMNMHFVDEYETNIFDWPTLLPIMLMTFMFMLPAVKFQPLLALGISGLMVLVYGLLWNHIHNEMHSSLGTVSWTEGPPKFVPAFYKEHSWFRTLTKHHAIHHLQKGNKYNFNIICLGVDRLMNTLKPDHCFDNTTYCTEHQDDRCNQIVKSCL